MQVKKTVNPKLQNTVQQTVIKKLTDLLSVDICYIDTVGFYQNLV